jgi:hypothetical protein
MPPIPPPGHQRSANLLPHTYLLVFHYHQFIKPPTIVQVGCPFENLHEDADPATGRGNHGSLKRSRLFGARRHEPSRGHEESWKCLNIVRRSYVMIMKSSRGGLLLIRMRHVTVKRQSVPSRMPPPGRTMPEIVRRTTVNAKKEIAIEYCTS